MMNSFPRGRYLNLAKIYEKLLNKHINDYRTKCLSIFRIVILFYNRRDRKNIKEEISMREID